MLKALDFTALFNPVILRPIMVNGNTTLSSQAESNRQRIEKWLNEFGFQVKPRSSPKHSWYIEAIDHSGIAYAISQTFNYENEIIIQNRIDIDGPFTDYFNGLTASELDAFLSELRLYLLMVDCENEGLVRPFKTIILSQYIYTDGLTQDTFFQRLFHVRKGLQVALAVIKDAIKK
jgi:hypothetical protein